MTSITSRLLGALLPLLVDTLRSLGDFLCSALLWLLVRTPRAVGTLL